MTKTNKETVGDFENNEVLADIINIESEPTELNLKDLSENVKIEDGTLVKVKSNVFGKLIYRNAKSGEQTEWSMCGDIQELTMNDLRAMKANQAKFFVNQWVVIIGVEDKYANQVKPADIYKALGITKYYENLVEPSDFKNICTWSEKEIMSRVSLMSENAKSNLIIALNEYISKGILDSVKTIHAFGRALGIELTEKD